VIVSFRDKRTEDIYHGQRTKAARKISQELRDRIQRKLDLLNAAVSIQDLRVPASNHMERLRGDLEGLWSIRVNEQYRIVFDSDNGNCRDVGCVDHH
jgi:proteic killer suppression protein